MTEPWEELVDAERVYIARRLAMFAGGGAPGQLRTALGDLRGRGAALRVLLDADVELATSTDPDVQEAADDFG